MKQESCTIDIPDRWRTHQFSKQSLFADLQVGGICLFSISSDSTIIVADDAPDEVKQAAIVLTKYLQENFKGHPLI